MSRLQHPNIVRLYELIDDPRCDQQFLVMECVRGWTLQRPVARRESIPEEDLRHWLREVYLGLEHLHIHGVAHRDVKPDNILWDPEQRRAKLTDFGTAALLSHSRDAPVGGTL
ncbi:hypothetical protein EMIHUDRAFT_433399, partial [Emiliania huxleyi CCMP1516]|uniref:non-specific serine/threonine protein kinase n=2 Tax=Emiliania huxleyi TaxID=2903 RepID=A0A0D3KUQ9_EMIH1